MPRPHPRVAGNDPVGTRLLAGQVGVQRELHPDVVVHHPAADGAAGLVVDHHDHSRSDIQAVEFRRHRQRRRQREFRFDPRLRTAQRADAGCSRAFRLCVQQVGQPLQRRLALDPPQPRPAESVLVRSPLPDRPAAAAQPFDGRVDRAGRQRPARRYQTLQSVLQHRVHHRAAGGGVRRILLVLELPQPERVAAEELKATGQVALQPGGAPHRPAVGQLGPQAAADRSLERAGMGERAPPLLHPRGQAHHRPRGVRRGWSRSTAAAPSARAGDGQLPVGGRRGRFRRRRLDDRAVRRLVEVERGRDLPAALVETRSPRRQRRVGTAAHGVPQLVLGGLGRRRQLQSGACQRLPRQPRQEQGRLARCRELALDQAARLQEGEPQSGQRSHRRQQHATRLAQDRSRRLQARQQPVDERGEGNRCFPQGVAQGGDVVQVAAQGIDLLAEPRMAAHGRMDQRRPPEQRCLHLPGVCGDRCGRRFQERIQVGQRTGQAACLHTGKGGSTTVARGACRVRRARFVRRGVPVRRYALRQAVEGLATGPAVLLPAPAGDAGDRRRVEPPAAAVDEAAAQHRDQVTQPPSLRGQAQQPPHPDAQRSIGERLAGHGIQRQVVLGEHLPRQAENRTDAAERHPAVGGTQVAVVGEAALDGACHGAQLGFAIGGHAAAHPRRRHTSAGGFDHRLREQTAQALVRMSGALAGAGIERQQQVAAAGERGQQAQLAAVEEAEAVDQHQGGQCGRVRGCRGRGRQRRRGDPAVRLQRGSVRPVNARDCGELRVAGASGRRRELLRRDVLGQQLLHRCPQHRQRGGRSQRREVGGGTGLDSPVGDADEQLARGPDRGGGQTGVESARHGARGLHLQVERHAARLQQPAAELVAVAHRGHQHQRGRKRVPPVPLRRAPQQRLALTGPGRPDYEGRVCDPLSYRDVAAASTGRGAAAGISHAERLHSRVVVRTKSPPSGCVDSMLSPRVTPAPVAPPDAVRGVQL